MVARLSGLPALVLLLAIGLLLDHAGIGWIKPDRLGSRLEPLGGRMVGQVLFDDGLNLRLAGRDPQRSVLQLVLVRSVPGLTGVAVLAHWAEGPGRWPWSLAPSPWPRAPRWSIPWCGKRASALSWPGCWRRRG